MNTELFSQPPQRILSFVQQCGAEAVIDGDAVVIINTAWREVDPGMLSINYRVERVRTLADAWAVLEAQGVVKDRRIP
jgi:hypothetical protein